MDRNYISRALPTGQQRIACMPSPTLSEQIADAVMTYGQAQIGEGGIPYFMVRTRSEINKQDMEVQYLMPDQALHAAREACRNSGRDLNVQKIWIRLVDRGYIFHGSGDLQDRHFDIASISPESGVEFCSKLPEADRQKVYRQLLTDVADILGVEAR